MVALSLFFSMIIPSSRDLGLNIKYKVKSSVLLTKDPFGTVAQLPIKELVFLKLTAGNLFIADKA